ncbi:MAG: tetratricopeptide repeat protein [Desulfobacteraceae bacterium]|nr:MAG: tetratricopeptide repeat protein [Desulfobacteraceae bacterium]
MSNRILTVFFLATSSLMFHPDFLLAATEGDVKVWPLFYYASDPVSQETRTEIIWPMYVRQQTSDYTASQLLSFSQDFPRQYPDQYYLFWPLGGVRAGNGHDAWLFPFLWSGAAADGDKWHHSLFPLFYFGKNKDVYSLNIAILQQNWWDTPGRFNTLFPLLWSGTDKTDTHDQFTFGMLPLGWAYVDSVKTPEHSSQSHWGGLFLLHCWGRDQSVTNNEDGGREDETFASDGVFPVFYRKDDYRSSAQDSDREKTFWLFPYYQSADISFSNKPGAGFKNKQALRHIFFPLWWDHSLEKDQTLDFYRLLFPLWWHSGRNTGETVDESNRFLVPVGAHFYKKDVYETHNLMGPVFNRTENSSEKYVRYDAFFPLFLKTIGQDRSGGRVFPLFGWETSRAKYENLWYAFPLGWHTESQEEAPASIDAESFWALHKLEERPYTDTVAGSDAGPRITRAFYPFYWSKRRADVRESGLLPFYLRTDRLSNRDMTSETIFPLLLGQTSVRSRDEAPVFTRHDYLLSMIARAKGDDFTLNRVFPFFSYEKTCSRFNASSFVLPFHYTSWQDADQPGKKYSSDLSVPFEILPVYQRSADSSVNRLGEVSTNSKSWFFPFYKHAMTLSPTGDKEELSILWPLWNGEWENDETRIRGIGGFTNFYEKDANGFVEQRILYRLFTRKTRSWFSETELMPFYSGQHREDGTGYWKFLGGLIGKETRDDQSYLRLFYFPIPLGKAENRSQNIPMEQQNRHADLALNYLKHKRHDRAAIEFALSGNARADDPGFQAAAGDACLNAVPGQLGDELRSTVPVSLKFLGGKYETENTHALKEQLRRLAIDYYNNAIRAGADKPEMLKKIAQAHVDLDDLEKALDILAESDRLSPRFDTAMARLSILDRMKSPYTKRLPDADRKALADRQNLMLKEIKTRYPASPTVLFYEADLLGPMETPVFSRSGNKKAEAYDPFSEIPLKQLALYTQGSALSSGKDEKAWLTGDAFFSASYGFGQEYTRNPPQIQCALRAAFILRDQALRLTDDKKRDQAAALFPRIRELLPGFCDACAEKGMAESDCYGRNAAMSRVLHMLYHYYAETGNDPLGYLETAEAWAAPLCPHLREAVDQCLENFRFENQYIKTWRIASVAGIERLPINHSNPFYEWYINLDAILGQPDHCTVTAECVIVSEQAQRALIRLGFDHTLSAMLNNKTIFEEITRKVAVRDEFTVPVLLKKGENRLKLTISDDFLSYGFFARLSDDHGRFIKNVRIQAP